MLPPLCALHFFLDGGGGGAYSRLGAYKLFLPTGWAPIRGWALNRINTVCDLKKIADTLLRKFVNSTCAYPINSFEEEESYRNRSASFRLQKSYKHITPSLRIMSTQGSHCEPPANEIIEPLTIIASRNGGKAIVFQSRFPLLASACKFSSGNRVWVKPRERNITKKFGKSSPAKVCSTLKKQ